MKPYSKDLRLRVLSAVDAGTSREEVARTFSVSMPTIKRWLKRRRQTGDVEPEPLPGRPARKGAMRKEWLPEHLEANHDLTLEQLAVQLGGVAGCSHERVLVGPEEEDRRCQRTGHAHLRGRSYFRRGPLDRQALRRHRTRRGAARPQKAPRLQTQARRVGEEAAGSGPPRTAGRHLTRKARVPE